MGGGGRQYSPSHKFLLTMHKSVSLAWQHWLAQCRDRREQGWPSLNHKKLKCRICLVVNIHSRPTAGGQWWLPGLTQWAGGHWSLLSHYASQVITRSREPVIRLENNLNVLFWFERRRLWRRYNNISILFTLKWETSLHFFMFIFTG